MFAPLRIDVLVVARSDSSPGRNSSVALMIPRVGDTLIATGRAVSAFAANVRS